MFVALKDKGLKMLTQSAELNAGSHTEDVAISSFKFIYSFIALCIGDASESFYTIHSLVMPLFIIRSLKSQRNLEKSEAHYIVSYKMEELFQLLAKCPLPYRQNEI